MVLIEKGKSGKGMWAWMAAAVWAAAISLVALSSQASADVISVSSATINDGTTTYPTVFEADWNGNSKLRPFDVSASLAGTTVTSVTVGGNLKAGGTVQLRVQLLDSSLVVISSGCVSVSGASPFSVVVDVVPDVAYSSVARVKALGLATC